MKKKIFILYFFALFFIIVCNHSFGYIDSTVLDGNLKTISPMDTAVFGIEVTNNYNWVTNVDFTIESVPEGWSTYIIDNITIDKNSEKTVYLSINPPRDFGFHDDSTTTNVIINKDGSAPVYNKVTVISRGFSIVGIEIIIPIIILVIGIPTAGYLLYKKIFLHKNRKNF